MIKTLRIDERLIHGQVAVTWCSALNIDRIIVANDAAATDEISAMSLKMAAPQTVKVAVKSVKEAIALLQDPRIERYNILLLVNNPKDALMLVQSVNDIPFVNVGNFGMISDKVGREMLATSLAVTKEERELLKAITAALPNSTYQMTPTLPPQNLEKLL